MKNPYYRTDHREAFDMAVKLVESGITDYREIAKQLAHSINREQRLKIAAKICHKQGINPPAPPQTRVHIEDIASPQTDAEAMAVAMWIQATPEQRLVLLGQMLRGEFSEQDQISKATITLAEAERRWRKKNLRQNAQGRLVMWKDIAGGPWLTTTYAMEVAFGSEPD